MEGFRLLTEVQAAELLGLKVQTLRNWRVKKKNLPFSKAGGAVRYHFSDIIAFMEENKVHTIKSTEGCGQ